MSNAAAYCVKGENYKKSEEYIKARDCFQKALEADPQCPDALYNLGQLYEDGDGVEVNHSKAKAFYKKAESKGHYKSALNLILLENQEIESADEWYELGEQYYQDEDYLRARVCWRQAIKIDSKHTEALYNLGLLYETGDGVAADSDQAISFFEKAAKEDHYASIYKTILMKYQDMKTASDWYEQGEEFYNSKNYIEARICYLEAIKLDKNHIDSLFSLGWLYEKGLKVDVNKITAKRYYRQAASNGDEQSARRVILIDNSDLETADDWYELAEKYYADDDFLKARVCYLLALENDTEHTDSLFRMGSLHENGEGTPLDLESAKEFYEQAAEKDHYPAIYQLLMMENLHLQSGDDWYELGEEYFETKSYIQARACYKKALTLDRKHKDSLNSLGWLHEYGKGTPVDLVKARKYYENDADNNKAQLKNIERRLIEQAVQDGTPLDLKDKKGRTALHRAAQYGCLKLYARLKYLGADQSIVDKQKKTPTDYLKNSQKSKVSGIQNTLTKDLSALCFEPVSEVIVSRMFNRGNHFDKREMAQQLQEIYSLKDIKPLLDLAKLAVIGRHKLSKRPIVLKDGSDSDDEGDAEEIQKFQVIIDSQNEDVETLVCSKHDTGKDSVGLYRRIPETVNTIYLGGDRDKALLRATMIHELCHFIANEVFDNGCRPYAASDNESKAEFTNICDGMKKRKANLIPIFKQVFDNYDPSKFHNELIVRVAQFIVKEPDGLQRLQKKEPALLKYYQENFLVKVKAHVKKLESKALGGWSPTTFKSISSVKQATSDKTAQSVNKNNSKSTMRSGG